MSNLFIISSAINTKFGVFNTDKRLEQTLHTIESIRLHDATAKIILAEMSALPLSDNQKSLLLSKSDFVIEFCDNDFVKSVYENSNWDVVKNITETACLKSVFEIISKNESMRQSITRIFKISGRYYLNSNFDATKYFNKNLQNKIVFKKKKHSQFDPNITNGQTEQFMSRLWSFDINILTNIITTYEEILTNMISLINLNKYIDIEHSLCQFFNPSLIEEWEILGVSGLLGPNGFTIED